MNILLAVDASSTSQAAVDQVAARPWPAGSLVQVLTVVENLEPWALGSMAEEIDARARRVAEGAAKRLLSHGLKAQSTVAKGDPKTVILDHAAAMHAELIVLGASGLSAVERFLLGSVSRAVLRFAPCSVALVRQTGSTGDRGLKILLAVDGSEGSRHATEALAARPWPGGTEIRVLSAVELGMSALQGAFEIPALDAVQLESQRAAAMKRTEEAIDSARKTLEAAGLTTSESISVLLASPPEIILQEAAAWPADCIVLGSHGSSGLSRFLIGSTSETVATHAACSVEVVRHKPQA
ncbi:MAG TPA: universal stress protein [Bryobacteraceae bacterium]|jgi:nucleotide-binding universal stress UspA family protein|nr:universal stress protein [Bryobacteraceae bacterium]